MSDKRDCTNEINAWRGECLNVFARGESAVGEALQASEPTKLPHLAGQRLAMLQAKIKDYSATKKQEQALGTAITEWIHVEERRPYLAHGVTTQFIDTRDRWAVFIDMVVFRKNIATKQRWALTENEAIEFKENLLNAYKSLSSQLGQFKKRAST